MYAIFNSVKSILLIVALCLFISGCTNDGILDFQEESLSSENDESLTAKGNKYHFNTTLMGKNVVPSPVDTKAVGQAIVTISKDDTMIHYKITTANIENVFVAHFHMAPVDGTGGPVALLYFDPDGKTSGPANGVLTEGYITISLDDVQGEGAFNTLLANIRSGNIYVNVHTSANPGGEIRGQL